MSHNGCFRKLLMRCPIDTASALACTVDSGSFGKGTSGAFGKWLRRCPIDTASALACTVDSGSFGKGTSGAISLTLAATVERSPTAGLNS